MMAHALMQLVRERDEAEAELNAALDKLNNQ